MSDGSHAPRTGRAHVALLGFALGSLLRRRSRALALGGGLVAAVALLSAVLLVTEALRAEAARARAAAPDLVAQQMIGGRPALVDATLADDLGALPGVARATPRVWGYLFLPSLQGNVTLVGAPQAAPDAVPRTLDEGRDLTPGERGACVVGRALARELGVRAGNHLRFPPPDDRGTACRITGVFSSTVALFTSDVVVLPEPDARALLGMPDGRATDIAVVLTNPDESSVVARKVLDRLPAGRVLERRLLERVHALTFGRRSGLVLGATLPALLALLVLAHDRASGLGPAERREIAILKACGWSTSDVLTTKLYEALLVALGSSALGLFVGYAWAFWLGAPGLREVLAGWSTLYPELPLLPELTVAQALGIVSSVTAPFVALSVVPAWRAAIVDPMEALRAS